MNLSAWWQMLTESQQAIRRALTLLPDAAPSPDPWYDRPTCMKKYRRARARRNAMANASRRRNR